MLHDKNTVPVESEYWTGSGPTVRDMEADGTD